jgi:hypothetical protein
MLFQVISILFIYFWMVVQRAYVDIGLYRNYSQAPTMTPIYMGSNPHYPAMPQHFQGSIFQNSVSAENFSD